MNSQLSDSTPRPARAWAIAATAGLFSLVGGEMLVLALRVSLRQRVILIHHAHPGVKMPSATVIASDNLTMAVARGFSWSFYLYVLTWALTATAFLVWLFRAVTFARSQGLPPNSTPFGAIVCWFIPIVNLVRPYNVVQSLYRVSRKVGDVGHRDWVRRWPGIFPLWWWSWLAGLFLKQQVWSRDATGTVGIWMQVAGFVCATVAASGAACIVWAVEGAQDALAAGSAAMPEFVPPAGLVAPDLEDDDAEEDDD